MEPLAIDVAIIGAGLAGLNCARLLAAAGLETTLLEASDAAGGRIRTDLVDGFRLDRGFQVLLTAYPEAKVALNYDALSLKPLKPGALVWHGNRFHRFADPFREPLGAAGLLFDPIVSLADKLRVARLRQSVLKASAAELFDRAEQTTDFFLHEFGFSDAMIDRFLAPFFGGIFLERELVTSSRFFDFLFRMFASGSVAVPELGMEEIPKQMAAGLPPGVLRTGARVTHIAATTRGYRLRIEAGQEGEGVSSIECRRLVIATEEPQARSLLATMSGVAGLEKGIGADEIAARLGQPRKWNRTTTFYYAAEHAPGSEEPVLMLNGQGRRDGPVNSVTVMSRVSSAYAPAGAELIAATVVGEAPSGDDAMAALERDVRVHLSRWFPGDGTPWELIAGYPIELALPLQRRASWEQGTTSVEEAGPAERVGRRVYVCGDYCETASIQGALVSGRRTAEALLAAADKPARD